MDWDKLRIFHAAAEAGSFTHAGDTLRMSQSAVSRQISLWSAGQARAAQHLLQACVLDQRRHADLDDALLGQNLLRLARSKARR